jgi:hypothetical protein
MKLMPKMTPDERAALRGMTHDQRQDWINAHRDELMKRKDQPDGGGFGGQQ